MYLEIKKKSEYFDAKHLQKIRTYSLLAIFYILIKKVQCSIEFFLFFYGVICCQVNLRVNLLRIRILEKIIQELIYSQLKLKMGSCFVVASSHASYHVHVYEYFLLLVCISLPHFPKRRLKQVFKFVETHVKKIKL